MVKSQSTSTLNLETLEARLESIESLLMALHSNAPYIEDEPFEGESPEGEQESMVEAVETSVIEPVASNVTGFIDGLGLRYFTGREVSAYFRRCRGSVCNSAPPRQYWNNLACTLVVLDKLRSDLGVAITITSSYRNKPYNKAVKGASNSQHLFGRAIDFVAAGGTPAQWGAKLKTYRGKTFNIPGIGNYVFHGGVGIYSGQNFVHVDTRGTDVDWWG